MMAVQRRLEKDRDSHQKKKKKKAETKSEDKRRKEEVVTRERIKRENHQPLQSHSQTYQQEGFKCIQGDSEIF